MGLDNIFDLFSSSEELDGVNEKYYVDFTQTPIYWVGMYKKLVLNNLNFNKKVVKFFKETNEELDIDEVSEAGEWVTYHRAWSYIKDIKIEDGSHIEAIEKYSDEHLDTALKLGISFFEEMEKYENCALLKKILDKSLEFKK
jgi:hypothetical protein